MTAILIGLTTSLATILFVALFKQLDKRIIFGLTLTGIGFLYVGYTWTDYTTVIISGVQVLIFILFTYLGIKKNIYYLAAGFFLHGLWDLLYGHYGNQGLLPPDYDLFCLTYDFVIGFYLLHLAISKKNEKLTPA